MKNNDMDRKDNDMRRNSKRTSFVLYIVVLLVFTAANVLLPRNFINAKNKNSFTVSYDLSNPKEAVVAYLDAIRSDRYEVAYHIEKPFTNSKTLDSYSESYFPEWNPMHYYIDDVSVDSKNGEAIVKVTCFMNNEGSYSLDEMTFKLHLIDKEWRYFGLDWGKSCEMKIPDDCEIGLNILDKVDCAKPAEPKK